MKKAGIYFFMIILLFLVDPNGAKATTNLKNIPIAVNDQFVEFPDAIPFVKDNLTYVPIRYFSDAIGGKLSIEKPGIITLKSNEKSIIINSQNNEIELFNGKKIKVKLFLKNGRNYAPLRILGEYFGFHVTYISDGPIVRLVNSDNIIENQSFIKQNQQKIKQFYQEANSVNKPKVYLTFDDGPNAELDKILDILKQKQAKASFFMIETQMRKYATDVKRLVQEGHYPALHSVSHNKHLLYDGKPSAVANEMLKAQKTLYEITGFRSSLTRTPFGSKPYMVKSFRDEMVKHQFKMWDWNVDSEDWRYNKTDPQKIVSIVKSEFEYEKNRNKPIVILFHITKGTASVLPEIIDFIYSEGYQCTAYNPTEHVVVNFWSDTRL